MDRILNWRTNMANVIQFNTKEISKENKKRAAISDLEKKVVYNEFGEALGELETIMVIGIKDDSETIYVDHSPMNMEHLIIMHDLIEDIILKNKVIQ